MASRLKRSREECTLVQAEMLAVLTSLSEEHVNLTEVMAERACTRKKLIMLICRQDKLLYRYHRARQLFSTWVELPPVPDHLLLMEERPKELSTVTDEYSYKSESDNSSDESDSSSDESDDDFLS